MSHVKLRVFDVKTEVKKFTIPYSRSTTNFLKKITWTKKKQTRKDQDKKLAIYFVIINQDALRCRRMEILTESIHQKVVF